MALPASGVLPAGVGHCSQKYAVPIFAAQLPNGPSAPGGRFAIAVSIAARRFAGGVAGAHGKRPSAQFVAAFRPKLRSWADNSFFIWTKSLMSELGDCRRIIEKLTAA